MRLECTWRTTRVTSTPVAESQEEGMPLPVGWQLGALICGDQVTRVPDVLQGIGPLGLPYVGRGWDPAGNRICCTGALRRCC